MRVLVTRRAKDALQKSNEILIAELKKIRESMDIGVETVDTWHDEGYKTGVGDEQRINLQLLNNTKRLNSCLVIVPEEQAEVIKIGNIVRFEYHKDNSEVIRVIDGISSYNNVCSVKSPLGQVLMGKKKGDVVQVNNMKVEIKEIYPPSHYSNFFKKEDS